MVYLSLNESEVIAGIVIGDEITISEDKELDPRVTEVLMPVVM
jgi:hypothetical protein